VANAEETYVLLARIAAVTYEPITYGDLEALTGVPGHFQGAMLGKVARMCEAASEPDLTSMVVKTDSREVSDGNTSSDPAAERYRCFQFHSDRAKASERD
jgi:hypothetical protein